MMEFHLILVLSHLMLFACKITRLVAFISLGGCCLACDRVVDSLWVQAIERHHVLG